ncbi:TatD family hydrolase [Spiroplasma clarkii]|uniref:Mg-dependent DNase n=1 Tax=Spiroplasma clarkii TaxID=2139 RepID=A0A2K8KJ21_9MOLU|nr:TatD family hydrolase [Spiroplasma clarkii]ATX71678.1 Mg-dependent DNase [Spiroplasma clarkii]
MGIFDTHTHFSDEKYKKEGIEVVDMISEAKINGVSNFCCVGYDVRSSTAAVRYAFKYEEVYCAVGIHPNDAHLIKNTDIEQIELLAYSEKAVAIGEIGLDYYYSTEHITRQKEIFEKQIKIALDNDLTVMLHIRDKDDSDKAYHDTLEILTKMKVKKAIVHCFTRGYNIAELFIKKGYLISIPGVVTFANATELQDAVKKMSINSMLVETDAPYLTPVPNRGKINTSKEIVYTVEKIAKLKNLSKHDVTDITTRNAKKIFGII